MWASNLICISSLSVSDAMAGLAEMLGLTGESTAETKAAIKFGVPQRPLPRSRESPAFGG